jgi:hypothetical protein
MAGVLCALVTCSAAALPTGDSYGPYDSVPIGQWEKGPPKGAYQDSVSTRYGDKWMYRQDRSIEERLSVMVGGGVEAYTSSLANSLYPGFGWGVTVGTQPLRWLGAEVAYSGAANNAVNSAGFSALPAGIVRNGTQAAVSVNLPTSLIQPYALAGLGVDWYSAWAGSVGLRNDVGGRVPLGGGFRARMGDFTADLRGEYDVIFDANFAPSAVNRGDAYRAMLQLGGRF